MLHNIKRIDKESVIYRIEGGPEQRLDEDSWHTKVHKIKTFLRHKVLIERRKLKNSTCVKLRHHIKYGILFFVLL